MFGVKYSFLSTKTLGILLFALLSSINVYAFDKSEEDYELKLLGKYIFFDKISEPDRMACVTCHDPATGWTGSVSGVNLHQVVITGANAKTVGNIKPPSSAYASFSMPFGPCEIGGLRINGQRYCGGNFWDGRSVGLEKDKDDTSDQFIGATKHIGEEIFYKSDGVSLEKYDEVMEYSKYFGPTSDQALNPMPNTVEQNIDRQSVCLQVKNSKYAGLYTLVWGEDINCSDDIVLKSAPDVDTSEKNFEIAFKRLMLAVGAYEHSSDMNSFSSKRDKALRAELACTDNEFSDYYDPKVCKHENYLNSPGKFPLVGLTDEENLGHDLFYNNPVRFNLDDGTNFTYIPFPDLPQAKCSECHSDTPRAATPEGINDGSELFQTYSRNDFHNLSIPPNPEIPGNPIVAGVSDRGIDTRDGFFRTPTVRNVDKRKDKDFIKAYMHNGWFKSLESVVHFYNTAFLGNSRTPYEETTAAEFGIKRCEEIMKPIELEDGVTEKEALANNCWPAPEFIGGSPIPFLLGDLHLSLEEEAALVAYLKTLSDEYTPKSPKPYKK